MTIAVAVSMYLFPQRLLLSMVRFTNSSALPSCAGSSRFTSVRDRSGRALFRLICMLKRGIAFASPANLGALWSPVSIDDSSRLRRGLYQARAAM